jgi:hypothetical protein
LPIGFYTVLLEYFPKNRAFSPKIGRRKRIVKIKSRYFMKKKTLIKSYCHYAQGGGGEGFKSTANKKRNLFCGLP